MTDTTIDRSEWDRRMADYLRLDALHRADAAFGALAHAEQQYEVAKVTLEAAYGRSWRDEPAAIAEREAAWDAMQEAQTIHDSAFIHPLWEAERNLVLTPAPDLNAALFKVDLIEREQVWNDNRMTRDCMEIVQEDMARLA